MDTAAFQATIVARVEAWRTSLTAPVREPLDEMLRRRGYLLTDDIPDYFGPRATPLLGLPVWVAETLRAEGAAVPEGVVLDAAEGALVGYFLIRVHDDLCDEDLGEPHVSLLVSAALQARMTGCFARAAGQRDAYWARHDEVWATYADAMLAERALLRGPGITTRSELAQVLARYRPLLLPAAAVLAHADRLDVWPTLEAFVEHLGEAVQLFNDVFDAEADLAQGNRTWVVMRYAPDGDADRLRRGLLAEGGLTATIDEAADCAGRARAIAEAAGWSGGVEHLDARIVAMREVHDQFFESLWRGLLGGTTPIT